MLASQSKRSLSSPNHAPASKEKLGRPKLGTSQARQAHLLEQSLTLFMTEGLAHTSVSRVAAVSGVSTRTIYAKYSNKNALLIAAIHHMVEQDVSTMLQLDNLPKQTLQQVLTEMGRFILHRVLEPRMLSFFRICVAEVSHIPELSRAMKVAGPERIHRMLVEVFAYYAHQGELPTLNLEQAAESFCELLIGGPRTKALFGGLADDWDFEAHLAFVVQLFLKGLQGMEPTHASA